MLKFLSKILKGKSFEFKIDLDKDGKSILDGEIHLEELLDEIEKIIKK